MDGALTVQPSTLAVPPARNAAASSMHSPPASADGEQRVIAAHARVAVRAAAPSLGAGRRSRRLLSKRWPIAIEDRCVYTAHRRVPHHPAAQARGEQLAAEAGLSSWQHDVAPGGSCAGRAGRGAVRSAELQGVRGRERWRRGRRRSLPSPFCALPLPGAFHDSSQEPCSGRASPRPAPPAQRRPHALRPAPGAPSIDLDQVIGLKPGHHQGALVSANDTR